MVSALKCRSSGPDSGTGWSTAALIVFLGKTVVVPLFTKVYKLMGISELNTERLRYSQSSSFVSSHLKLFKDILLLKIRFY